MESDMEMARSEREIETTGNQRGRRQRFREGDQRESERETAGS